jgi:hypothetical protein
MSKPMKLALGNTYGNDLSLCYDHALKIPCYLRTVCSDITVTIIKYINYINVTLLI